MDTKQIKMIELLSDLQQFAKDERLPIRLIDRIEECKNQVTQKKPIWDKITIEADDLLESISHKVQGDQKEVAVYEETEITMQDIKNYINKVTDQEHKETLSSLSEILHRRNLIVKACYQKMNEITFVDANIDNVENQGRFLQFFQDIKEKYDREMVQLLNELINNVQANLSNMMEQMKNMFQSIEGYTMKIGNNKFYTEYSERKETIDNGIKSEIDTADFGGKKILDYAHQIKNGLEKIVRKYQKKMKFLQFLPILLVITFVLGYFTLYAGKLYVSYKEAESVMSVENDGEIKQTIENVIDSSIKSKMSNSIKLDISIVMIVGYIIIKSYMKYRKKIRLKYEAQIASYCGDYLKTEIYNFEKENQLDNTEEIKRLVFEYEQQYRDILNCIFENTQLDPFGKEELANTKIEQIKESWNQIKYM